MEKLPENLDKALRIIAKEVLESIHVREIRMLLAGRYIIYQKGFGWTVNEKGMQYLALHKS